MQPIISIPRDKLKENADDKTFGSAQKFFKEKIKFYGVKVPVVHNISKELYTSVENLTKEEIFTICEEFWRSGFLGSHYIY